MDDLFRQAIAILRGMWQRRWAGVAIAWAVAIIGAVVVWRIPDRYEATAKIYVDTQSILKPLMSGLAIAPNVDQQVSLLARTLISRPNVEKLMRSSDMDLLASNQSEKDRLVDQLISDLKLAGGRENLYTISYRDVSGDRARRVVQNFVSMFVESGLGDKRRDSDTARRFIDDQIKSYEARLREAENRLKEFRLANLGLLAGGGASDYVSRVAAMTEELQRAQLELRSAEQSRASLKEQLTGEIPSLLPDLAMPQAPMTPELDARIDGQRKQLDELLRRYTEQHPDVIITRRLIEQLEAERKKEIEVRQKAISEQAKTGPATNPIFQQIKIAVSEAEAMVASLKGRVGELQSRIERMKGAATRVPELETEMSQMNRDYEILRSNYGQLVSRREAASMGQDVDVSAAGAEFRMIEPPRTSPTPVFPNRLALVPLVLALALGAGLFTSFALAQVYPTVHDGTTLRQLVSRPLLGSISMLVNPALMRRRRVDSFAFASALSVLVLMFGAWFAWVGIKII